MILKPSTVKQVYCKAFVDDSSGVELLGFESTTNLFKQGINLFDHCCETLRTAFYGFSLLTDIITSAEDNPEAHGGLFDLLESIKIALTVFFYFIFYIMTYIYILTIIYVNNHCLKLYF